MKKHFMAILVSTACLMGLSVLLVPIAQASKVSKGPNNGAGNYPGAEGPGADKQQSSNHGDCKNPGPNSDTQNTTGIHNGYDCRPSQGCGDSCQPPPPPPPCTQNCGQQPPPCGCQPPPQPPSTSTAAQTSAPGPVPVAKKPSHKRRHHKRHRHHHHKPKRIVRLPSFTG